MEKKKRSGKIRLEFVVPPGTAKKEEQRIMKELLRLAKGGVSREKDANTTSNFKKGMV